MNYQQIIKKYLNSYTGDIALPDMLFQMARFLVGLATELALVWPVIAHHLQVLLESQARVLGWYETCWATCEQATGELSCEKTFQFVQKKHTHTKKRPQESNLRIHSNNTIVNTDAALPICACEHMLLPKSVMRMGSCRGMSGRGRLLLDTLALLVFRGNLCFFCCRLLKWEAMCVFLWPDVRKILSQWGQGKGRAPG